MQRYSSQKKWLLICQNNEKLKSTKMGPKAFIEKLKDVNISSDLIAHLSSSLNGEPPTWADSFIQAGGIGLLVNLIKKTVKKEKYRHEI